MSMFDISPLSWEALLCCFLSGVVIGLERQLRGKPVGVRTSALICTGTYVFIAMTRYISTDATDPSRIIGQVVTGIGFLGAGRHSDQAGGRRRRHFRFGDLGPGGYRRGDRAGVPVAGRQGGHPDRNHPRRRGCPGESLRSSAARRPPQTSTAARVWARPLRTPSPGECPVKDSPDLRVSLDR